MSESNHLYIRLSGTPYERGLKHGTLAKERIAKLIETYKLLFDKEAHIEWEDALEKAARYYVEPIAQYRPDLIEEMRGIAEGSGQSFETIVLINSRSEIMFALPEDACSVIGVPPEASGDGKTYLSQNWDWWTIGFGTTVILEVEQEGYPKSLIVTEAGLVGGKGLNAVGIGVSLNALSAAHGRVGVPTTILLRNAVQQATFPKAIDAVAKAKRAGAACIGLGHSDGQVIAIEAAPSNLDILLCDGKPLCHTNHWISPIMTMWHECTRYSFNSTYSRLDRVRRLSRFAEGHLQRRELFAILSDHACGPDSVCRHDDMTLPIYHRHTSLWSMVLDLNERTLWLTEGSPCCTEARAYPLR